MRIAEYIQTGTSEDPKMKLVYRDATPEEIAEMNKVTEPTVEEQIAMLKAELSATDYKALKYAEGWIYDEEYEPIRRQRQALRDKINELESME